jgi:hypothetical protein
MEKRKTRILFADDKLGIRMTLPLILVQERGEGSAVRCQTLTNQCGSIPSQPATFGS